MCVLIIQVHGISGNAQAGAFPGEIISQARSAPHCRLAVSLRLLFRYICPGRRLRSTKSNPVFVIITILHLWTYGPRPNRGNGSNAPSEQDPIAERRRHAFFQ